MFDAFDKEFENSQKLSKAIRDDLKTRADMIQRKQSTIKLDAAIRSQLRQLNSEIETYHHALDICMNNPSDYNLTTREVERRSKIVEELTNLYQFLHQRISPTSTDTTLPPRISSSYTQEYDIENMTTKDMQLTQKSMMHDQDHHIESLSVVIGTIKKGQMDMTDELRYQNTHLLPKLQDGIERNTDKMVKVNKKLMALLKSKSTGSLYCWLILQGIIFLLLILH